MVIKDGIAVERILYCDICKSWTKHVINKSHTEYLCSCGTSVIIVKRKATAL